MKTIEKPWGEVRVYADTSRYRGKILFIKAGHAISRHVHPEKDETWLINRGRIIAHIGELKTMMTEGETVDIPHGVIHRAEAMVDSEIIEWCSSERGFKRLEDEYGRLDEY
jgi:mannose-6-phosphate isomerase-like protein (cupin superfamily)